MLGPKGGPGWPLWQGKHWSEVMNWPGPRGPDSTWSRWTGGNGTTRSGVTGGIEANTPDELGIEVPHRLARPSAASSGPAASSRWAKVLPAADGRQESSTR